MERKHPLATPFYKFDYKEKGYVYLLRKKGKVVYVGSTKNLGNRIASHITGDKDFDDVCYQEVEQNTMLYVEFFFIDFYKPKYNKNLYPPKGLGTLKKLKKPNYVKTEILKKVIDVLKVEPFMTFEGEKLYLQDDVEQAWSSVFGKYDYVDSQAVYEKLFLEEISRQEGNK